MGAYILNIDSNDIPMEKIPLAGSYQYLVRIPAPTILTDYICQNNSMPFFQYRLLQIQQELADYEKSSAEDRYLECMPGVYKDRYNTIEMYKGMRYSKEICWTYSVWDKLDYAIAYEFNTPLDLVRARLLNNCKKYGADYRELSYAFCGMHNKLLPAFSLNIFVGVSEQLDLEIRNILAHPEQKVYIIHGHVLNLSKFSNTNESRITMFLLMHILHFTQLVTNALIYEYKLEHPPFVSSRYKILLSRGIDNIVVTTTGEIFPPVILHIDNLEALTIKPIEIYKPGGYNEDNWYSKGV